jgi:hypothetical protein
MHHDDEHYRRQLYTVLPNLTSLSCGLSVAIRLVKNRPITRLIIPTRPDCLESDQLERVIAALQSAPCSSLRRLTIERRFASRDGLMCITKGLRELRSLSLVISYTSEVKLRSSLSEISTQLKFIRGCAVATRSACAPIFTSPFRVG